MVNDSHVPSIIDESKIWDKTLTGGVQELPGSLATALVARLPDSTGRLSRSSSWSNLTGAAAEE